jgi:nicotinate phosphoribosyltransferase
MIKSILDTDLYKFSTSYAYFSKYPLAEGTFTFTDRNRQKWSADQQRLFGELFKYELNRISELKLTGLEQVWCKQNIPYIPAPYWEWLSGFQFNPMAVYWGFDSDGVFWCEVTDALYKVTLYEIMVLATYAELRNLVMGVVPDWDGVKKRTIEKINKANAGGVVFSEFGTRRRFSTDMQELVISMIKEGSKTCLGTSNVYLAMKYGMKPIGTFPHEWVMMHAACFGYKRANFLSLEDWIKVYKGDLGIALVDTYTTKSFLHTLTKQQAILLQGFRQDSGDEFVVGNMIIDRLNELGIDPKTKTIVFSNALDMDKACDINEMFKDRCKPSFGIGTNLTCDVQVDGYKPANIVMKLSRCRLSYKDNWEPCLKISDDQGKHMGSEEEFQTATKELGLEL